MIENCRLFYLKIPTKAGIFLFLMYQSPDFEIVNKGISFKFALKSEASDSLVLLKIRPSFTCNRIRSKMHVYEQ